MITMVMIKRRKMANQEKRKRLSALIKVIMNRMQMEESKIIIMAMIRRIE